jgi:hypothetical protein
MRCAYCATKFAATDEVIAMDSSEDVLHAGQCFTDYIAEHYAGERKTYLEYLEERANVI